ncbi:bile acid:sodium symporter family protein [Flavicella sp.]|uniref:bile acid:sodium symporter family protein n=1 Tax=Flavicella sp. TaxID=2957742 RepID=UPI002620E6F7|nr:bile acid:sodium symporter family protein [Flavicella sp.]MDG1803760.1 bile acid:sodium symporter family protein [Flavicella sp.]MDG2279024.1 bile acid:sodium symporter family protein [Flavicella sp.]
METSILTAVILPVSLAIIMLGMGLTLKLENFKKIFQYPKAAIIGLTNQLIVLPIIGFVLAISFDLSPDMAMGLMIIAACPGGPTSNLITHIAKGDIALSISLTAITSMLTVFTIPIILSFALNYFTQDSNAQIELPILNTIIQITGITIVPVTIGMLIKNYYPKFADNMESPMRIASTVIFVAVLLGIILANKHHIVEYLKKVGLIALALNIATMALGFYSSKFFQLNLKQSISITIESGIQNGTLAIVIATSILQQTAMSIPAAVYSLLMFLTSGVLIYQFGRKKNSSESVA